MENKYEAIRYFKGLRKGRRSIIFGGVHGNETPGIKAVEDIPEDFKIQRGSVLLYFGNPRGIELGQRFVEADLNRMFNPDEDLTEEQKQSYEYRRAQKLKKPLLRASALLDLHGTRNPKGVPFLIAEPHTHRIARALPFHIIVSGFDNIQPGGTDYFMNHNHRIGICAECGYNADPASIERAKESINLFLIARGHIDGELTPRQQRVYRLFELYRSKSDMTFERAIPDFEPIPKGTLIGYDGDREVVAPTDCVTLFISGIPKKPEEEAVLFAIEEMPN